jgi:hypothetical protein
MFLPLIFVYHMLIVASALLLGERCIDVARATQQGWPTHVGRARAGRGCAGWAARHPRPRRLASRYELNDPCLLLLHTFFSCVVPYSLRGSGGAAQAMGARACGRGLRGTPRAGCNHPWGPSMSAAQLCCKWHGLRVGGVGTAHLPGDGDDIAPRCLFHE